MIEKHELNVWKCTCEKCGCEWISKSTRQPKVCTRCKSAYWNVPKEKE